MIIRRDSARCGAPHTPYRGCRACSAGVKRKAGGLSQKKEVLAHLLFLWAHQGMILGPPDYESGALTN